ncbi:MAG: SDR family NAD(P)-dependent oxidoreductase [Rhodoferax sp.]
MPSVPAFTPVALVTGCSSGIGLALAVALKEQGALVYASVRRVQDAGALQTLGLRVLQLDVNDDASVAQALECIQAEQGCLHLLVNNAGFSQVGAVLDLEREDLRRQYETNVIAPVALARAALPLLRTARAQGHWARIANMGSIVGLFTTPFAGAYCSSKAALHALSDALRMELAPLGVEVVCIQPGGVLSRFGQHAQAALRLPAGSLYTPVRASVEARAQAGQVNATPAQQVAQGFARALLAKHAPLRVRGGRGSTVMPWVARILPTRVLDRVLRRRFGLLDWRP